MLNKHISAWKCNNLNNMRLSLKKCVLIKKSVCVYVRKCVRVFVCESNIINLTWCFSASRRRLASLLSCYCRVPAWPEPLWHDTASSWWWSSKQLHESLPIRRVYQRGTSPGGMRRVRELIEAMMNWCMENKLEIEKFCSNFVTKKAHFQSKLSFITPFITPHKISTL